MLFNSYAFIFAFVPVVVTGYFLFARCGGRAGAQIWLIASSLFFYGWWNPVYLPLLGAIMLFNFWIGQRLLARPAKAMLAFGIAVDLAILGYFKYADFLVANLDRATGLDWKIGAIVLPLAISFFTFQKIAYLVDSYRGLTRGYGFREYCLFVSFFPQLIAGPIVHYREILPQFRREDAYHPVALNFAVGIAIFSIGLAKKVLLADGVAPYADPLFARAAGGVEPDLIAAWAGALAYSLQLYFDFSGYSDMAIGVARLFGVRLPLNFNSPYKATSIIDFWRRWHMTLSHFLRDYLYFALGGNRRGAARRHLNLFLTMLLGGLWHGAAWTFVIWGALHGFYLIINHGWRQIVPARLARQRSYRIGAWLACFVAVVVAWVLFRAPDVTSAGRILAGMAGLNGVLLPSAIVARLPVDGALLAQWHIGASLAGGMAFVMAWAWIVPLLLIARFGPNTQQIMMRYRPALDLGRASPGDRVRGRLQWRPTPGWAVAIGVVAGTATLSLARVSSFLYFQF